MDLEEFNSTPADRLRPALAACCDVPEWVDGILAKRPYGDLAALTAVADQSLRELDDHNLVIYLNTFSKVMAPGLRLGWIAAAPSIVEQIAIIKQRLDPHTPNLVQMAVARMLRQGSGHLVNVASRLETDRVLVKADRLTLTAGKTPLAH